ncbi:hypothetical protein M408DRAFT_332092 [Serendipita vermifera MAFF 305830]|uniref:Uncharacterized protein n=1 Tax=Serendipita vermifera MAFF 305830 TaxID=933852 RepID=A0A0C2X399_SERVB|nr:hypothetical protein M408DRAFT_332092 [Serendipita vermifera MAFF 305830]
MRATQLLASKRLTAPILSSSCRSRPLLSPRTFATASAFTSSRPRIQESTRLLLQNASSRSYWWSSKPAVPPAQTTPTTNEEAASSIPEPVVSAAPTSAPSNATDAVPVEAVSVPDLSSTPEALSSLEALQAATTEFSALASLDYSHFFSWVWPAGVYIRLFSFLQDFSLLSVSPIACMVIGIVCLRVPLSYFQLKGQKAQAAWAPYQQQFKTLSEEYQTAMKSGNKIVAMEKAQKLLEIREQTKVSPFAGLVPAFGLAYVGIGSFIGMGRLATYQKEVEAMGGAGPLANPEGFLGSGWLTDLTAFDPGLWVIMTGLTWLNVRRSALDAPTSTPWMSRMPYLITPVFGVISLLVRFSGAQMLVGIASIGYTVLQSYLLRVPKVRQLAGMQGVKNQDPKTFKFPGFLESWREAFKALGNYQEDFVAKRTMAQQGTISPAKPVAGNRESLRVKDAPSAPKFLVNPYLTSPPAPPPPKSMPKEKKGTKSSEFVLPADLAKRQANMKKK